MNKSQRGFTIIEALIGLVLIGVSFDVLMTLYQQNVRQGVQGDTIAKVTLVQNNLASMLNSPVVWQNVLAQSSSLVCVRNQSDCRDQGGSASGKIAIYDSNGSLFYNSATASAGFDFSFNACMGFPSSTCPMHANIYWQPICPPVGQTCSNPLIEIHSDVVVNYPGMEIVVSNQRYSAAMILAPRVCPVQSLLINLAVGADVSLAVAPGNPQGNQFVRLNSAAGAYGYNNVDLATCTNTGINFQVDATTGAAANNNTGNICFFDSTAADPQNMACVLEWRYQRFAGAVSPSWSIFQNGSLAYTPISANFTNTDRFTLQLIRGLIWVKKNGLTEYISNNVNLPNLRVRFTPSLPAYSPDGIFAIDMYNVK